MRTKTGWVACVVSAIGLVTAAALAGGDAPSDSLELPKLNFQDYKAGPFIDAAIALQALGKDKACQFLRTHGKDGDRNANSVIVLLRMLFVKKADGEFRRPRIGGATFFGGTKYEDWPLEPIELVDGVPFLITRGYILGGHPEPAESYLDYCLKNCDWNDFEFKKPSEKELRAALVKLVSSEKWKTPLDGRAKDYFAAQIK